MKNEVDNKTTVSSTRKSRKDRLPSLPTTTFEIHTLQTQNTTQESRHVPANTQNIPPENNYILPDTVNTGQAPQIVTDTLNNRSDTGKMESDDSNSYSSLDNSTYESIDNFLNPDCVYIEVLP